MKAILKRLIPYTVRKRARELREFREDRRLYSKHSGPEDVYFRYATTERNAEMQITKDYHRVEKGLALGSPKRPFGAAVEGRLSVMTQTEVFTEVSAGAQANAVTALAALQRWNGDGEIDDSIAPVIERRDRGVLDPERFFASRRSVRDFGDAPVPRSVIEEAARHAAMAPSVCNRRSWKLSIWDSREDIDAMLKYQNGNAGFGETIPAVGLVTVERGLFAGPSERNQPWIEGGIFAMSFVMSLHAMGLDTCMLNMSGPNKRHSALKKRAGIPESEAIIAFVAFGYSKDGARVARSEQRELSEVLRFKSTYQLGR